MNIEQGNHIIPVIHRLVTDEYGENYWFNGCARYVMEALGEYTKDADLMTDDIYNLRVKDNNFGFWLFAGLTGRFAEKPPARLAVRPAGRPWPSCCPGL